MSAQQINPWRIAIDQWLDRVANGSNVAAFRDSWLRIGSGSTADLEMKPANLGSHHDWLVLQLDVFSFGKRIGTCTFGTKDEHLDGAFQLQISSPKFSEAFPDDLKAAVLQCMFQLAPPKTQLEVLLEDVVESATSTLEVAGIYTNAGWGLNPANTELISESPRRWIFRFSKN